MRGYWTQNKWTCGREISARETTECYCAYISIHSIVFSFQRLKYCITSRSLWQPICGKAKRGMFRYPFCTDADWVSFLIRKISSFQVARCYNLRTTDGLLALRRRNRSGHLPEYILRRGGLPRGAVRGCFGAGEGLRREAFGARPKV